MRKNFAWAALLCALPSLTGCALCKPGEGLDIHFYKAAVIKQENLSVVNSATGSSSAFPMGGAFGPVTGGGYNQGPVAFGQTPWTGTLPPVVQPAEPIRAASAPCSSAAGAPRPAAAAGPSDCLNPDIVDLCNRILALERTMKAQQFQRLPEGEKLGMPKTSADPASPPK